MTSISQLARPVVALAAALSLAACGRDRGSSASAPPPAATSGAPAAAAGALKPACPANGEWSLCSVTERLEAAGLAPRRDSSEVRDEKLVHPGVRFTVGNSELDVFIYADSSARRTDEARLDHAAFVAYDQPQTMRAEPTLIRSANLLAILRSRNDHQRERVADAITAGPPQAK